MPKSVFIMAHIYENKTNNIDDFNIEYNRNKRQRHCGRVDRHYRGIGDNAFMVRDTGDDSHAHPALSRCAMNAK